LTTLAAHANVLDQLTIVCRRTLGEFLRVRQVRTKDIDSRSSVAAQAIRLSFLYQVPSAAASILVPAPALGPDVSLEIPS
jgi:hypothetical protein